MVLSEVFDLFVKQSPVTVMVRATMENVLSAERLDELFARTAVRQRPSELLFSLVADLMGTVVCGVRPSMHAAFQARSEEISVSINALYDKLKKIEPQVIRTLVRDTSARLAQIIDHTEGRFSPWLPGYRVKILDGNHLRRSERRLKELRTQNAAPLPGHSLVMLDPERMLAIDMFPCEDGHAQERSLLGAVLPTIEQGDVIVADRNFCTMNFLAGIADAWAGFIIRQHRQTLRWELDGRRRQVDRIETGAVYEQWMRLFPQEGEPWLVRRITVELDQPTRDGDTRAPHFDEPAGVDRGLPNCGAVPQAVDDRNRFPGIGGNTGRRTRNARLPASGALRLCHGSDGLQRAQHSEGGLARGAWRAKRSSRKSPAIIWPTRWPARGAA